MPLLLLRHRTPSRLTLCLAQTAFASVVLLLAGCAGDAGPSGTIAIADASSSPNASATRDREVAAVYAAAKTHDVSAIMGLSAQLPAPSPQPTVPSIPTAVPSGFVAPSASPAPAASAGATPTPVPRYDPAVALALYYADPKTYADSFVASYPTDADGVMHDFGSRFVAAHVDRSGALFPIDALASLAAGGNEAALRRLYEAMPASAGGINAAYARTIADVSSRDPGRALATLALVAPAARLDVIDDAAWCGDPARKMAGAVTTSDFAAALKGDLADRLRAACAIKKRSAPKRHGRPKHAAHGKAKPKAKKH